MSTAPLSQAQHQPAKSYHEVLGGMGSPVLPKSIAQNVKTQGPNASQKSTQTSAPLVWHSRDVSQGAGHLAGQGASNIGSLLKTEF